MRYDDTLDLEKMRERLRKMTDEQLIRHGKAARSLAGTDNPSFAIQLREARAEWRRRHLKENKK